MNVDWIQRWNKAQEGHYDCAGQEEAKVLFDMLISILDKLEQKENK